MVSSLTCFDSSWVQSEQPHSLLRAMRGSGVSLSSDPVPVRALVTFTRYDLRYGRLMAWCSAYGLRTGGILRKLTNSKKKRGRAPDLLRVSNLDPVKWDVPSADWKLEDNEPMFGVGVFEIQVVDGLLAVSDVVALRTVSLNGLDRHDDDFRVQGGVFAAARDFAKTQSSWEPSLKYLYDGHEFVGGVDGVNRLIRDYGTTIVHPRGRQVRIGGNIFNARELGVDESWNIDAASFASAT